MLDRSVLYSSVLHVHDKMYSGYANVLRESIWPFIQSLAAHLDKAGVEHDGVMVMWARVSSLNDLDEETFEIKDIVTEITFRRIFNGYEVVAESTNSYIPLWLNPNLQITNNKKLLLLT